MYVIKIILTFVLEVKKSSRSGQRAGRWGAPYVVLWWFKHTGTLEKISHIMNTFQKSYLLVLKTKNILNSNKIMKMGFLIPSVPVVYHERSNPRAQGLVWVRDIAVLRHRGITSSDRSRFPWISPCNDEGNLPRPLHLSNTFVRC